MTRSILSRVDPERIVYQPYPYAYMPQALDPDLYGELAESFPGLERIAGRGPLPGNQAYLLGAREALADPALPAVWKDFFAYHCSTAFLQEMLAFWRSAIEREYPDLESRFGKPLAELSTAIRLRSKEKTPENLEADLMMDCQFGVNTPVTTPSAVRGPHVDKPLKLFAALLYFRHPDDDSRGGDLTLYRLRSRRHHFDGQLNIAERFVEPFREIPYRPNTLITWLNTGRSLHGISPRSVTDVPRRYVNFLAEGYRCDGFFQVPYPRGQRLLDAAKRAAGLRDV